jgi:hypothetical protein
MLKRVTMFMLVIMALSYGQSPYLPGETVLSEHNLSWTDNNDYSTNIFDEITINKNVVVIFWGSDG